jgi:hypothetical protein
VFGFLFFVGSDMKAASCISESRIEQLRRGVTSEKGGKWKVLEKGSRVV